MKLAFLRLEVVACMGMRPLYLELLPFESCIMAALGLKGAFHFEDGGLACEV